MGDAGDEIGDENKIIHKGKYNDYMKKMKPKNFTKAEKLICGWTDKKNYLIQYRMLKFYVRHGLVVENKHALIYLEQSMWLEKDMNFNTLKRNEAKNDFEKDFYKLLKEASYGKTTENVRNRLRLEVVEKAEFKKQ